MFTGLIQATGQVLSLAADSTGSMRLRVSAPGLAGRLHTGDSIAVSGVCLTALDITADPPEFSADLAAETLARTSLSRLAVGTVVNLELPTPAGTPLGGHIVQGHVDGTGELLSLAPAAAGSADWCLRIRVPEPLHRFMVEKGSIAIEGISLTIARWDGKTLGVAIIPHTYTHTNLHTLRPGAPVNLEADVLLKFARAERAPRWELTLETLISAGF